MSPIRALASLVSPAGRHARLSVLIFHRVLPEPDPLFPGEVDVRQFDRMLAWLKVWFNVLPLGEAVQRLSAGALPARAASITFDDGYADNHDVALPLLARHRLPATFFVATGFLDGGRMWNDTVIEAFRRSTRDVVDLSSLALGRHRLDGWAARRRAIEAVIRQTKYLPAARRLELTEELAVRVGVRPRDDLMMSSDQVRALRRAGMQIGAHTVTHPILARLDPAATTEEIVAGRRTLESLLGERVGLFAYPNGRAGTDYRPEHPRLVEQLGFDAALTTDWGAADAATDRFRIPRFTPWDRHRVAFGLRLMRNLRVRRLPAGDLPRQGEAAETVDA
jgi:peptidoglycan/xylan/chitin deacetylase (PgdA/CDA1 family)